MDEKEVKRRTKCHALSVSCSKFGPAPKETHTIIMAYDITPYVGMTLKKNGGHIESVQMTRLSALDQSTASMSPIRHCWVLPWATELLTLLESIAKVPDPQVAKMGQSSIFWLLLLLAFLHCDSTTTAQAMTTIQTRKNSINHWVLYPILIVILELELFFSDSQALRC